jgi:hypothetical protein
MCGCEGWSVSEHKVGALRLSEIKVFRKVYGPKRDTDGWRIRTDKELQDQYRRFDRPVFTIIKVRRMEWAGHIVKTNMKG